MTTIRSSASAQCKIPVYEVRLVRSRRPLRLAEPCLVDPKTSARAFHALIGCADREHFACLFVNLNNEVTGAHIAAIGAQHAIASIDARAILRTALAACASAMVVSHNHPSGNPRPSDDDRSTTEALMRAALVVGIPILDHVIVTPLPERFYSMHLHGTLPSVSLQV